MTASTGKLTTAGLRERIRTMPRIALAALPTPLEDEPRLSRELGGPRILVKRDDLTGLAFGGNKVRELEFFLGDAAANSADVFIAGGGVGQSNHARQCTAAAVRAGLEPVMVPRPGVTGTLPTGNLLLTRMLGANIHWVADDPRLDDREAMAGAMDTIADEYRGKGRRPYVLYSSVHPLGAVSYVECAVEIAEQLATRVAAPVHVYVTSMGVTHVGLALGFAALGLPWKVTGIAWRPEVPGLAQRLAALADATARLLNIGNPLTAPDFVTLDYGGPEYGVPSPETWEAIALCARMEGLFVDPVYSGKGMAGLIDQIRRGFLEVRDLVVFVHTGGLPALFAYADAAVDSHAFTDAFA